MEAKIESSVNYDDRRKELTHTTTETREAELGKETIGKILITSKGIYNEGGIRKIFGDLISKREILESNVKTLKELQDPVQDLESTPELKKLKENLKMLQLIDHKEKITPEDLKKEVDNLKKNEAELKKVKKDIEDIKSSIGNRLKI